MSQLDENTYLYQSLIKVLAIDSYVNSITAESQRSVSEDRSFEALFEKMQVLGMGIKENMDKKTLMEMYHEMNDSLKECIKNLK